MQYEIGQLIIGTVTKVKPFAVFMQFEDGTEGLLHISEISDAYIRDIEKYASIGDKLKVMVVSIDSSNGFLRLSLKKVPEEEAYSTHVNNGRVNMKSNKDDFKPLADHLNEWIDIALANAKKEGDK